MALSCSRISQAMLSKKVMLAKAADASRKTSPQEALSHSSARGQAARQRRKRHAGWAAWPSLTDERRDDVVHALQEAGQMLRGRVVGGRNLSHHRCRLGPGCFHAAVIGQDVGQAQDSIHLPMAKSFFFTYF